MKTGGDDFRTLTPPFSVATNTRGLGLTGHLTIYVQDARGICVVDLVPTIPGAERIAEALNAASGSAIAKSLALARSSRG